MNKLWLLTLELADKYNGKEERYMNEVIDKGGLDFSDFSEICRILDLMQIVDAAEYFNLIVTPIIEDKK